MLNEFRLKSHGSPRVRRASTSHRNNSASRLTTSSGQYSVRSIQPITAKARLTNTSWRSAEAREPNEVADFAISACSWQHGSCSWILVTNKLQPSSVAFISNRLRCQGTGVHGAAKDTTCVPLVRLFMTIFSTRQKQFCFPDDKVFSMYSCYTNTC